MPDTTCKFGQFVQQRGKLSTTRWKLFFSKLVSLLTLLWPSPSRLPTPCRLLHTSSSCCAHPVTPRTLPETSLSARSAPRSNSAHPSEIQSTNTKSNWINYRQKKQECIPVGCVLSAAVAVWWGVVCLGSVCPGGVCPGGCLPRGCLLGRWCLPGDVHLPPVDRILDTRLWKHYISATSFADGNYKLDKIVPKNSKLIFCLLACFFISNLNQFPVFLHNNNLL